MSLVRVTVLAVLVLMGLPLVIILAALAGPVGWIAAAIVLPLAVLGVLLWLGWFHRREDDGPYGGTF